VRRVGDKVRVCLVGRLLLQEVSACWSPLRHRRLHHQLRHRL